MSNDTQIIGSQRLSNEFRERLGVVDTSVLAEIAEIQARVVSMEHEMRALADTTQAKVKEVADRIQKLADDPAQHTSTAAWEETEKLVEDRLLPVQNQLPKGLLTKVRGRLKESRELLKKVPDHRAAMAQMRGVKKLLEDVAAGVSQQ